MLAILFGSIQSRINYSSDLISPLFQRVLILELIVLPHDPSVASLSYLFLCLPLLFIFASLDYTSLPVLCFLSVPLLFWSGSLAVYSDWDKSPCSLLLPLPVLVATYLFSSVRHIVLLLCQSSLFILRSCGLDS